MDLFLCAHCQIWKERSCRHKSQSYCGDASCQKARKRSWHQKRLLNDPVYRQSQSESQQSWRNSNRDYWKKYREKNPEQALKNCLSQKQRDLRRSEKAVRGPKSNSSDLAKMDASNTTLFQVFSLIDHPVDLAKMDASVLKNKIKSGEYIFLPLAKMDVSKIKESIKTIT